VTFGDGSHRAADRQHPHNFASFHSTTVAELCPTDEIGVEIQLKKPAFYQPLQDGLQVVRPSIEPDGQITRRNRRKRVIVYICEKLGLVVYICRVQLG